MLRKKLIYTDPMAVPDTNVHRFDLDAMRDPSFLHTDLVYQDVFRAKTHWYIWIWHFLTPRGRMLLLIHLAAHFCIIIAIALGATSVIAMALHCRPIKYNYTIPFENPRYCFRLRPFVVTIAIVGVILDAVTWYLPHQVVWNLRLRLSHKMAVSLIFAFGLL
jgi:hypothetical protein